MRNHYKEAVAKKRPADASVDDVQDVLMSRSPWRGESDEKTKKLHQQLRDAIEVQIEELNTQSDAYDALGFFGQALENIKATATGLQKGVTEYIPDFGELGAFMDMMDIDTVVLLDAIATGRSDFSLHVTSPCAHFCLNSRN